MELPGTERTFPAEMVLLALGFLGPERKGPIADLGVKLDERGNVVTDPEKMTSVPGVFAAGDMVRGQSLVVWAIHEGRKAARGRRPLPDVRRHDASLDRAAAAGGSPGPRVAGGPGGPYHARLPGGTMTLATEKLDPPPSGSTSSRSPRFPAPRANEAAARPTSSGSALALGLPAQVDAAGNVVVSKAGSKGREAEAGRRPAGPPRHGLREELGDRRTTSPATRSGSSRTATSG